MKKKMNIQMKLLIAFVVLIALCFGAVAIKGVITTYLAEQQAQVATADQPSEADVYAKLGYGQEQIDVVEVLSHGYWLDEHDYRYEFDVDTCTKYQSGKVVERVNYTIGTVTEDEDESDYSGITNASMTFVITYGSDEGIATLSQVQSQKGIDEDWKLQAAPITEGVMENNIEVTEVTVEGLDGAIARALGADGVRDVEQYLEDFVKRTFPATDTITYDGRAYVDDAQGRIEMTFTVGNRAESSIRCAYNMNDQTVTVW